MWKHVGEKCGKLYFHYSKFQKGHNFYKGWHKLMEHRVCEKKVTSKNLVLNISAQYVKSCRRKVQKTVYFQYSKFQKGHNSYKNWHNLTTPKLDLRLIKRNSHTQFQLNISKHVAKNCGKLCTFSILSSKRENSYKNTRTWSKVHKKVTYKISAPYLKACRRKVRKSGGLTDVETESRTETRTDVHHHTIIRPVSRQAYKNV